MNTDETEGTQQICAAVLHGVTAQSSKLCFKITFWSSTVDPTMKKASGLNESKGRYIAIERHGTQQDSALFF